MTVQLSMDGVCKTFGAVPVVQSVSLVVAPGEIFFLLGPSGCGKTTLLRCIAGFCEPTAGRILMDGRDITRLAPHRRDISMVFQSYALWPHMTVEQNVAFGLEMRGVSKAEIRVRVGQALERVRMADRAREIPNRLSGGQQQRIALARALVVEPKCILLDEPLSNLDARLRLEMREEIRTICKAAGLTAVYVTHDQKEALSIADRLAVMHEGRVLQVGTPQEVYAAPGSRFVAGFVGESNFLPGTVERADARQVCVRTALGPVLAARRPGDADLSAGLPVTLSLRPEAIRLGPCGDESANRFNGLVRRTVYYGELAQHWVDLRVGEDRTVPPVSVQVMELNPSGSSQAPAVAVWVAARDVVVLKE